jgi:multidrug resistance efflux pump
MLLLIPAYIATKLLESSLDVAVVQVNTFVVVAPELSKVEHIYVKSGQKVKSGDMLIKLDSDELEQELKVLDNTINQFQTEHDNQYVALLQQKQVSSQDLKFQQSEFKRYEAYNKSGAVSLLMLSSARQNMSSARDSLREVEDALMKLKLEYQQGMADLTTRKVKVIAKLNSLTISTKSAGIINSVLVEENQNISPGSSLLTVDNGRRLLVHTYSLLDRQVTVKIGWKLFKCTPVNLSNHEKNISIIGVNKEKSEYLLECDNILDYYLVDNQYFYIWN